MKSGNATYQCWADMRQRCRNPRHKQYKNYGARGIGICARWESFDTFISDMGPKPEGMSIDRIDNNSWYSPENCRWATKGQQNRNKRTNRMIRTVDGRLIPLVDAAKLAGIHPTTLQQRIDYYGMGEVEAMSIPKQTGVAHKTASSRKQSAMKVK